ncbi:unnamed protein product [Owenia fusiformis]|uniref:Uncharacterized protein n=1 Tax=Owenia fusiformis TaxID=6347 RepID=A0A8J1T5S8_OWEFU|nr:unnamed protein product [Owenia fusiformis]
MVKQASGYHSNNKSVISKLFNAKREPHLFSLASLIDQSELDEVVTCPNHEDVIKLVDLAPDVMLCDFDPKYILNEDQLILVQSQEYALGDGSYGSVYRGRYNQQTIAAKVYNTLGDIHPHKMMRQEVTILRRLNHPSILSMVAIGLHPRVLVLELAPLGSLGSLLKAGRTITRHIQHRIAVQVADGLSYLHQHLVIYRDMKPDNVLIFSLSLSAVITAKISDYGISRFAAPYGLSSSEGTPGYRAPEVARGEPYTLEADIFSFGITLYELVTGGRHPFDELAFRSELDEAVLKGKAIEPITTKSCAPWPDLQELLDQCLLQTPESRPTSHELFESLNSAELLCLKSIIPVSKGLTVECMTVRSCGDGRLELWVGSGDKDCVQISWVKLTDSAMEVKGLIFKDSRILCMTSLGVNTIVVGSQSGKIWVYDTKKHQAIHSLRRLSDSVLCLQQYKAGASDTDVLLAGLADGHLVLYNAKHVTKDKNVEPELVKLGNAGEPIKCCCITNNRVYIGCGSRVVAMKISNDHTHRIDGVWDTAPASYNERLLVSCLCVKQSQMYLSTRGSAILQIWDIRKGVCRSTVDIEQILKKSGQSCLSIDSRITSLMLQSRSSLWVGTGGGHLVLFDAITLSAISIIQRHASAVRHIIAAQSQDGNNRFSGVLTAGLGFLCNQDTQSSTSLSDNDIDNLYGCIAVWDSDLPQQVQHIQHANKTREEWKQRHCQK